MRKATPLLALAAALAARPALAQHEPHNMPGMAMPAQPAPADTTRRARAGRPAAMPGRAVPADTSHAHHMTGMDMGATPIPKTCP